MHAVARLINNSRTIRAVRDLRERQKSETLIPGWEYSIGCTGHCGFKIEICAPLTFS